MTRLRAGEVELQGETHRPGEIDLERAGVHRDTCLQVDRAPSARCIQVRSMTEPHWAQVRALRLEKNRSNTGGNCFSMSVSSKNSS